MSRFTEVASMEYDDPSYKDEDSHDGPLECFVRDDGMFSFMMEGGYTLEIIVPPDTAWEFARDIKKAAHEILERKQ